MKIASYNNYIVCQNNCVDHVLLGFKFTFRMWLPRMGPDGHFGDFVEGLGPSQLVGRQVLGSPCLGEIQLGLFDRKGHLEVEVIRARGLSSKPGTKLLPGR